MPLQRLRVLWLPVLAGALLVVAFAMAAQPAHASTRDDLKGSYQSAVINYEKAVGAQDANASEIVRVEDEIAAAELKIARAQDELGETAATLYKNNRGGQALVDLLLESESFEDAIMRYEQYEKIAEYYHDKAVELAETRNRFALYKTQLENRKAQLQVEVEEARQAAEAAAIALLDNTHSDGAQFHQTQGVGNNCGATSFIVAVNTILHENRYVDNVAVWSGPGFNGDSTTDIAWKGATWLIANGLYDLISIETVPGDIHTAQDMRAWLEEGYVIVASSGPGSTWQRADGSQAPAGSFPYGHYVMFYCYDNGVFYANDSSVSAAQGAGCAYTEGQMQQWLDGRENHFAVALKKR